jgi:four helix bundle protein
MRPLVVCGVADSAPSLAHLSDFLRQSDRLHDGTLSALFGRMGKERDLRERTMQFALQVLRFCRLLPDSPEGRHVRSQLFRAGTSVAANYRSACRGRSRADFIAKLGTVIEEADESDFWAELSVRAEFLGPEFATPLRREADELVAIFTQSQKTARARS